VSSEPALAGSASLAGSEALDAAHPRHARLWPAVVAHLPPGELAHDRWHILRVYAWALRLAPEAGADRDCSGAAALVHDLAVIPKDHPDRAQGGERSAALAKDALWDAGYAAAEVSQVCEAVRTSSWSRGLAPANPVGVVLQDADRLDALGAVGLMRTVACAQWMSRGGAPGSFYHPADPLAERGRALDDRAHALDHCYAKLLSLAAGMHTATARREAGARELFLRAFLDQVRSEAATGAR
jgi:uncharacterized protein